MEKMDSRKKAFKVVLALMVAMFFALPHGAFAAVLSITPSTGTYKVGDTLKVNIQVSSYTQAMNAVSGTLAYPKDSLSIVSVAKGSLLSTWLPPGATGPTYSTSAGTIHFEGVLIGGYTGGPKTVFTATFKVKKAGTANLSFRNGAVLANDGLGTDLTQSLKPASFKLAAATPPAVTGSTKNTPSKTPTKTTTQTPPEVVAQAPADNAQVVNIVPGAAAPVITPSKTTLSISDIVSQYYDMIVLGAFGLMLVLILLLFVRITKLTKMVQTLQAKKRAAPRRKPAGFSAQKVPVKSKSAATPVFKIRGLGNK